MLSQKAQLWSGGLFIGRILATEIGKAWWKGSLEYGFDLIPVLVGSGAQHIYGGGFEPIVLRWNSGHTIRRLRPYIELAGGAVVTNANLPQVIPPALTSLPEVVAVSRCLPSGDRRWISDCGGGISLMPIWAFATLNSMGCR